MNKRQNYLDPDKQHTLTEQECNLIGIFRAFSKTKRDAIFKIMFFAAMDDAGKVKSPDSAET